MSVMITFRVLVKYIDILFIYLIRQKAFNKFWTKPNVNIFNNLQRRKLCRDFEINYNVMIFIHLDILLTV